MRYRTLILSAIVLAAAAFGLWKWRQNELAAARRAEAWGDQRRIEATKAVLERPIELSGQAVPLADFAAFISRESGLAVDLDIEVLEAAGVSRTHPIVVPQGRFSLAAALDLSLESAEICYDTFDQRLVITTPESAHDYNVLRTVVYPLPQPGFAGSEIDAEQWADLVSNIVEPEAWDWVGGIGHCEPVRGTLVIAQSEHIHRRIKQLLLTLSQLDRSPQSFAPVPIEPSFVAIAERKVLAALKQPAGPESVQGPLDQVLADLSRRHGIRIIIRQKSIEAIGVVPDQIVSLEAAGITLESLLSLTLDQYDLAIALRGEALLVTTRDYPDSPHRMPMLAFPIHDLVAASGEPDYDPLIELLTTVVDPESWVDVGGPGILHPIDGWLLVVQTVDVQNQIEQVLTTLREQLHGDQSRPVLGGPQPTEAESHVRAALDREIPLRLVEEPLVSAMDRIGTEFGIPVVISRKKMEEAGVKLDVPINCDLPAAPLRSQLRLILEELDLTFTVRHEVLLITTVEDVDDPGSIPTRVYDVRALLDPDLGPTDEDQLIEAITSTIAPEMWVDVGGPGSVLEFQRLLVVSQTDAVHEQLDRLLMNMQQHFLRKIKSPERRPTVVKIDATPCEAAIEALLDRRINVDLQEVPLEAALQELAVEHGLPLVIDRRRLDEHGVNAQEPVSLKLRGLTLRSVLRLILDPLELTWRIRDGVFQVTTPERHYDLPVVGYRVDDLWEGPHDYDPIIEVITTTVAPEHWSDVGGPGDIKEIGDWILIAQNQSVHAQIELLLAQMRQALHEKDSPAVLHAEPASPVNHDIRTALKTDAPLTFDAVPLARAVRSIGEQCGIPVVLHRKSLEEAGVSSDQPVTCDLAAAPLASQLRLLLEPLGLTYVVRHESLLITTPEDAERPDQMPIRVYDTRRLIDPKTGVTSADELYSLIETMIAPNSWIDVGGPGSLRDFRGLLPISQTDEVHQQIEALLAALAEHCLPGKPAAERPLIVNVLSSPVEQRIEELLNKPVDVDLCGDTLRDAIERLADRHDLPLVINPRSLEWALWPSQLVTYSARGQRLGHVLDRLLAPSGMTYMVRDSVVLIVGEDAVKAPELRLYASDNLPADKLAAPPPLDERLAELVLRDEQVDLGGQDIVQLISADWIAVTGTIHMHDRVVDFLAERRTQSAPPRELARRQLRRELDVLLEYPEPQIFAVERAKPEENPFHE